MYLAALSPPRAFRCTSTTFKFHLYLGHDWGSHSSDPVVISQFALEKSRFLIDKSFINAKFHPFCIAVLKYQKDCPNSSPKKNTIFHVFFRILFIVIPDIFKKSLTLFDLFASTATSCKTTVGSNSYSIDITSKISTHAPWKTPTYPISHWNWPINHHFLLGHPWWSHHFSWEKWRISGIPSGFSKVQGAPGPIPRDFPAFAPQSLWPRGPHAAWKGEIWMIGHGKNHANIAKKQKH